MSDKVDAIMNMISNGHGIVDPNNVPLASLVAHDDNNVDVNFIKNNNFDNKLIGTTLVTTTIGHILLMVTTLMVILMAIPTVIIEVCPLILKSCKRFY